MTPRQCVEGPAVLHPYFRPSWSRYALPPKPTEPAGDPTFVVLFEYRGRGPLRAQHVTPGRTDHFRAAATRATDRPGKRMTLPEWMVSAANSAACIWRFAGRPQFMRPH